MAESHSSTRAVVVALLANLGIAIAKFVAFFFTRSSTMLAEGVHSVADTGNQALLLLGHSRGSRPPTAEHPFGYGRERYFWAFVVAVVLFSVGALFALYEGVNKLRDPHEIESPEWAFGVLGFGLVLEVFSLRTAMNAAQPLRRNASWWSFIRRTKEPELPVVLLEDAAAVAGLVLALTAIALSVVTGNPRWDAAGTIAIGLLLGVVAYILALEMQSLLIGESASERDRERIVEAIGGAPDVERLIHLRTQHLGPAELLVVAKVSFSPTMAFERVASAINEAERRVREAVPQVSLMFIEPDVWRAEPSPVDFADGDDRSSS